MRPAPPDPARVALLVGAPGVPVRGPSGASAHVRGLFAALQRRLDARLFAVQEADSRGIFAEPVDACYGGLPPWPRPMLRWRRYREVLAARRLARALVEQSLSGGWSPALLLERHSLYSDAGLQVADRLGLPWLLEVNAPAVDERAQVEELRAPREARRWERGVLMAAPRVVAPSRALCAWLEAGVGCRSVAWVPNGSDLPIGDRAAGRRALGLTEDDVVVGFVGSMRPWHGVERLPAIAAALGAVAVAVGAGATPAGVRAPGFLAGQSLADAIAAFDLAVAPTLPGSHGGFCPLKILDYRSQGVPVVGSDVGDAAVLIGEAGAVAPAAELDGLIDLARQWTGRRTPVARRSWDRVVDDLLNVAAGRPTGTLFSEDVPRGATEVAR